MGRIEATDNYVSVMMKMAGQNIGGLTVLKKIFEQDRTIDPYNSLGGIGTILILDDWEIHDSKIWIFYKDICGEKIPMLLACMRAVQLGIKSRAWLMDKFHDGYGDALQEAEKDEIMSAVRKELPNFAKAA